jgi:3D (Asp-Asp-Asp) domain-containing protein
LKMNTSGDPFVTADWYRLSHKDAHKVVACPPSMAMGTKLFIEGIGNVVCHDRGGAIKNKRIDLFVWVWIEGMNNVYRYARIYAWPHRVYLVK